DSKWTTDRILKAMKDEKKDAFLVNLKKPIPVLIVYASAMARENGEVDFYDDVYHQDANLQKALARGYPYPDCCDPAIKIKKKKPRHPREQQPLPCQPLRQR